MIAGRFRPRHLLILGIVASALLAANGLLSRVFYRPLGTWLQNRLCESAFGGYSTAGLVLVAAISVPLLGLLVGAAFWIRHGLRMVREKTNQLPGHKPMVDTALIEGPAAVRGGWMEIVAGVFVILACAYLLLGPVLGVEKTVLLQKPAEMPACKHNDG